MGRVIVGVLLAAGAGSRMGKPKALVRDDDGTPWLTRAVAVLLDGGCERVVVVLGAAADEAEWVLAEVQGPLTRVDAVRAEDWKRGMSASLGAGLGPLADSDATAALVHLVDLPDVTAAVVRRVLSYDDSAAALARAAYRGRPGHPVLIGREHWAGVLADADGDAGARGYLAAHDAALVECSDLASGRDVDRPA